MDFSDPPYQYLYRVLRPDEDVNLGLQAKAPSAKVDVETFIEHGSYGVYSQYISTSASYESVVSFAKKGYTYPQFPRSVAKIDTSGIPTGSVEYMDLTDVTVRNYLIPNSERARNFARFYNEVLIIGKIPASAIVDDIRIIMTDGTSHRYLYRVLRPSEDPTEGLTAKDPSCYKSVSDHVAFGTGRSSSYISTCSNISMAHEFARLGISHGDPRPKKIVTIDVAMLKREPGIKIIDLTHPVTRDEHCGDNDRASRFADHWDEVLIKGKIPASCIIKVDEIS